MALSATLLLTLVSVSCSQRRRTPEEPKPDLGVVTPPKLIDPPVPQPKPEPKPKPKPRFEGWTTRPVLAEQQPHLVLLTERARGEKIRFWVDAPQDKRKDVWVDLNNNARKDKGEEIDRFGAMSYRYSAREIESPVITIYGEVSALGCYASSLSALDASGNTHLKSLSCYQNALKELRLGANSVLTELACGTNQLTELELDRCPALTELYERVRATPEASLLRQSADEAERTSRPKVYPPTPLSEQALRDLTSDAHQFSYPRSEWGAHPL